MNEKKSRDDRVRNWTFVLYPESAPKNWIEQISEMQVPVVISPLHDKDIAGDGSLKKSHHHIALIFEGNKSFNQVCEITDKFNAPIPQKIHSVKATIRYFAHLDDPKKAQYSTSDIMSFGGVDVAELLKPTSSARYDLIDEIIDWIDINKCTEYFKLVNYSRQFRRDDWFPLLADSATYFVSAYIKSIRHSADNKSRASTKTDVSDIAKEALDE